MSTQALTSWPFWHSYLVTARPYLFFVSGAAGLVGLALRPALGWGHTATAFFVLFVSYGLGQALTDVYQTDTDALSAPYRPLVRGLISPTQVKVVSLSGFALCALVLTLLNPWTLAMAALGVFGLATYTWFKRRWWGGPLYNAWIVALLAAIGYACGGKGLSAVLGSRPLGLAMLSVLFSYAVFVLLGYLKDISADRTTGYDTLPVRFGWRTTVAVSAVLGALSLAASTALIGPATQSTSLTTLSPAVALWFGGAASLVVAHIALLRTFDEARAHAGIGWSVRGFVLLHLGEAAALRPALVVVAVGLYAMFELVLVLRPERTQI